MPYAIRERQQVRLILPSAGGRCEPFEPGIPSTPDPNSHDPQHFWPPRQTTVGRRHGTDPGGLGSDAIHTDWGMGWVWIPAADGHDERDTADNADATALGTLQMAAITCVQIAIIPMNRAIEASAAASSTTARNMMSSLNEQRT